jgi:hypothetical protein
MDFEYFSPMKTHKKSPNLRYPPDGRGLIAEPMLARVNPLRRPFFMLASHFSGNLKVALFKNRSLFFIRFIADFAVLGGL